MAYVLAHSSRRLNRSVTYTMLVLFALLLVGPYVWMVSSSLKRPEDIYTMAPTLIPRSIATGKVYATLENYKAALSKINFVTAFGNTMFIAVVNTVVNLFLNTLAAYAFARLRFPGREIIFRICLVTLMIPSAAMLIPQFYVANRLHLYNTRSALILPFAMSVYNVFMTRQFLLTIPRELDEAAKIDGAGYFTIFWRVVVPLSKPILVTLGLFTFLWNYNNFLWPLIMLQDKSKFTMPLALAMIVTESQPNFPVIIASTVLLSLPLILIFVMFQRHFTEGITLGAIKG